MKVFSINLYRYQMVKLVMGIGVLAYLIRVVLGVSDQIQVMGITFGGLTELFFVAMAFSITLLVWDIRDRFYSR